MYDREGAMNGREREEKLRLALAAAIPDPAKLLLHLSEGGGRSEEESDQESETSEGEADRVEGWMDGERRMKKGEESLDWLSTCIIESWGALEYVGLARGGSVALLGRRGDASLQILWAKPLKMEEGEEISSILLMGMSSRRVSGSIDGLVVLVGTSDGRLFILTETAAPPLFTHRFTQGPITAMRAEREWVLLISETEMAQLEQKSLHSVVAEGRRMGKEKKRIELEYSMLTRSNQREEERGVTMDGVISPLIPTMIDRYVECSMKKFHGRVEWSRGDTVYWLSLREGYGATAVWESEQRERVRDTIVKWGVQYLPSFLQSAVQSPELKPAETKAAVSWRVMGETRFAISLHPAPADVPLVAVADNLARVAVVESFSGQIVRVWKGYRDASCGWMRVEGEGGKRALFLVILAPRRNLLEIWSAPNGRRVAARQVRGLALLESSSVVLNGSVGEEEGEGRLYLLGYKGNLYEITISFDSLLQLNTDDEQHDRIMLKERSIPTLSSLPSLVSALKTSGAKRMAVISYIHLAVEEEEMERVMKEIMEANECLSPLCSSLLSLCQSYSRLARVWEREERTEKESDDLPWEFDGKTWRELRGWVEKCVEEMKKRGARDESDPPLSDRMLSLAEFITSFNLHTVPVKMSLGSDPLPLLSFLFTPLMEGRVEGDEFSCAIEGLRIGQTELSSLFTLYWQTREGMEMEEVERAVRVVGGVMRRGEERGERKSRRSSSSSSAGGGVKERMEETARKSSDPIRGAILLTILSLYSEREEEEEEEEFENVREDVQRLEGILRASCVLARLAALCPSMADAEGEGTMSIEQLAEGGTGAMRERVARVVSMERLLPVQLMEDERIRELRDSLPHSLDSSLLCAETAWTLMREWTGKSSFESCVLAVEYAKAVADRRLRSQLVLLLWSTTLLGALRAIAHQSRGAEREMHAQLVPGHRVTDFITCLFSLLSSLIQDGHQDEETETLMEKRGMIEEWIEPVMRKKEEEGDRGRRGRRTHLQSSVPSSIKCESLVEVLQRQGEVNERTLHLHRLLLAAIHVTLSVGRSASAARDLFPSQLHPALFSQLSMRVREVEEEDEGEIPKRRAALIERACNFPNPAIKDSLLFLCMEWELMTMWQASDARRFLRESRDEEGCLRLASLPTKDRIAILQPAVAVRLRQLVAEKDVLLSSRDESELSRLCGDEYVDETTIEATKKLLQMLRALAASAAPTRQLLQIANSYFGIYL